ncbi:caspase domain-containing protein [Coprinopsis sp. MPI-PUGE-AT-0042]|nr:caspase domain-containing protein [Coprinopsis sp. MPI-PUGE-AT-0042]
MSAPGAAVFALVIGLDNYKSGSIWNLHYCVDDAKRVEHWLHDTLEVPKENIKVLLDNQATKENIECAFMDHLVNNSSIQHGDAILVYFAGHGSHVPAPRDWYHGMRKQRTVEVLCTYDHDIRDAQGLGRIAGLSDRSVHAMLNDLAEAKGDNIAFIVDSCFNPSQTPENIRERSRTRWTPTAKATGDDLYRGLWPSARADLQQSRFGFLEPSPTNYVVLAACSPGNIAVEGREGGHFTAAFLQAAAAVPLHRTSYVDLFDYVNRTTIEEGQKAVCLGKHKNRLFLDDVPFVVDGRFLAVALCTKREVRVEAGSVHGVIEGCELSLHSHNYRRSQNPPLAIVTVVEAHPTWSLAQLKSQDFKLPKSCWGRITRWNNEPPFRVKLMASIASVMEIWKLKKEFPTYALRTLRSSGVTTQGVNKKSQADISVTVQRRGIVLERHDAIGSHGSRVLKLQESDPVKVINEAATFNLHFKTDNPARPLENVVRMDLHDVDSLTLLKVGPNLLNPNGKSIIHPDDSNNLIFHVTIRNGTRLSLWPVILAMDPDTYRTTIIYQPPRDFDEAESEATLFKTARPPPSTLPPGALLSTILTWPSDSRASSATPYKRGILKVVLCSSPVGSLSLFDTLYNPLPEKRTRAFSDSSSTFKWTPEAPSVNAMPWRSTQTENIWDSFTYPVIFAHTSDIDLLL